MKLLESNLVPLAAILAGGWLLSRRKKKQSGVGSIEDDYYAYHTAYTLMKNNNIFLAINNMLDHRDLFTARHIDYYLWEIVQTDISFRAETKEQEQNGIKIFLRYIQDIRDAVRDQNGEVWDIERMQVLRKDAIQELNRFMVTYF